MGLGPEGGLNGKLENVVMYADISVDLHEMQILMQAFQIDSAG